MSDNLDILGKLLMGKLRDVSIELCEGLTESRYESPGHKEIQKEIENFSPEQKQALIKCVTYCIDGGINDFLFNLDKASRNSKELSISLKGEDVSGLTEGLHRELYGAQGWQQRFSRYGIENT